MSLWYWVSEINFDKEVRKKKNFSGSDKMFTVDKVTKELQNKYYFFKTILSKSRICKNNSWEMEKEA